MIRLQSDPKRTELSEAIERKMSRWGKNRLQPYTLPLDVLVKEKENTNRPVAARSAGTIGKWGITSFTSIRTRPIYGK